ncbi:hypothetical protein CERSUDRAFT_117250 [Gelatoporia subvermispora B]|uniref:Protein kinase domain-containing protein n=1 Tax=Ceriporiopsis subvermispora (strain B) TaxID=914234 RepID=M2R7J5_CERS8|nr:hypothetical protein CERSUDRAFT_117250 [Gelatoporia subvermispora B]
MTSETEHDMDNPLTPGGLLPLERWWRDRQLFLQSRGYMLRPRLRDDWTPSWFTSGKHRLFSEDGVVSPSRPSLIDARRICDNALVYIKRMKTGCEEMRALSYLSSDEFSRDPRNHCVRVLEILKDPDDPNLSYVVMPFLRPMDSPPFAIVSEVIDFVDQILEGLVFLHEAGVAHRDCARKNILMDGNAMFPSGFHPIRDLALPDYSSDAPCYPRSEVPVRYYYVDFGISVYIPPDRHPKLSVGADGRDQEVPELSVDVPYNPFKVDIFIIGNLFRREFHDKFSNVDFLSPLIACMIQTDPAQRPDAREALLRWQQIRAKVSLAKRKWRLRSRDEAWSEAIVFDTVSIVKQMVYFGRRLGNWGVDTQG